MSEEISQNLDQTQASPTKPETNPFKAFWKFKQIRHFTYIFSTVLILILAFYFITANFLSSREISYPEHAHYHFRLQLLVDGEKMDFSQEKFQIPFDKSNCSALLTPGPIHFHDGKDQMVHIHWLGITGGEVLKNYGLNLVGGLDDYLGFRWDNGNLANSVPIYSKAIPKPKSDSQVFVYTGDAKGFVKRESKDFLYQDLEKFFGHTSNKTSFNWFTVPAFAHEATSNLLSNQTVLQSNTANSSTSSQSSKSFEQEQAELSEINEMIGNVVVFIQKDEPTQTQIQDRFNNLLPLENSACGG